MPWYNRYLKFEIVFQIVIFFLLFNLNLENHNAILANNFENILLKTKKYCILLDLQLKLIIFKYGSKENKEKSYECY